MKSVYISFLAIALIFTSCSDTSNSVTENNEKSSENSESISLTNEQVKLIDITTTNLENRFIDKTLQLNGKITVAPSHLVSISSILGGRIKSIKVLPGNIFKKGEVLAVLEDEKFIQLQQDYLIAKAQLLSAQIDFERQKDLNLSKTSSDKTLQAAEATYRTLLATKKGFEEKLKLININPNQLSAENITTFVNLVAPFNGVVSKVFSNVGQYLNSSDVIMEIIDNEGILVNLKAFEQDLLNLELGQTVEVYTNQNPDNKLNAKIVSLAPNIENDGSSDVLVKLEKFDKRIISGLYVNADIVIKNHKAVSLPMSSVVNYDNTSYVFIQTSTNNFTLLPIKIGTENNGFVEVLNPDNLINKKIVLNGAYDLLMALKNEIEE